MNIVVKRILISLCFVVSLLLLYAYLVMVFLPKDINDLGGPKYYNFAGFNTESKNTIDVVMCGNSDVQCGFSPMELYKSYGITAYARGGGNQSATIIEDDLKDIFKRQTPKVVMIDVDCFFFKNEKWHGTNIQKFMPLAAPVYLHARWKELTFKDFVTFPKAKNDALKGWTPETKIYPYTLPQNYMQNTDASPAHIEKSVLKNFDNIVKMCKKHNSKILLSCLPSPVSWNNAKSNAIGELAIKYELPFVDLNLPATNFELDYSTSFKDNGNHLSAKAAIIASKFYADYLNQNFELTDHRGSEKYKSWDNSLLSYNKQIESL